MHRPVYVAHSLFIEGSQMIKNTASECCLRKFDLGSFDYSDFCVKRNYPFELIVTVTLLLMTFIVANEESLNKQLQQYRVY